MFKCLDPYSLGKMDLLTLKLHCDDQVDEETMENVFWYADTEKEGEFEYVKFLENLFDDGKKKKKKTSVSFNKTNK